MRSILFTLIAAMALALSGRVWADDPADARKAFDTFVLYSKTDDERMLDLFANDVSATFVFTTSKGDRDKTLPPETFLEAIRRGLAKKDGNSDTYEDIQPVQEGDTVRLTCTRIDGKSGERSPFVIVYGKDAAGTFKIKAMKMRVSPPKVKPGQ